MVAIYGCQRRFGRLLACGSLIAEHHMVLGFGAEGARLLFGVGLSEELVASCRGEPLVLEALLEATRCAQDEEPPPVIVIPGASPSIEAILDDPEIETALLLLLSTGELETRRRLEEVRWRQWPRVGLVDLEYCPPRVVEDTPGAQRLQGGLGLVAIGLGPARGPSFVPMARLLPGLRSPLIPARIAAAELEAARECQARLRRAEDVIRSLTASWSWRITAPLRAAKAELRGRLSG
jgi:hypothetical protein